MYSDVVDLRGFYASRLGQVARRALRRQVREIWPDVRGQSVLGLGYATPLLRPFLGEADRVMAGMPARQGVVAWPSEGPNRTFLSEDTDLPFPDLSIDRVLVVHGLEASDHLQGLLQEVWRVLAGQGRVLCVVPNRTGLWARFETTPFGHGHPFTAGQLSRLLRTNHFAPELTARALYLPPWKSRMMLRSAEAWEKLGARWFEGLSGVVMVEATKQVYRIQPAAQRQRRMRPVLLPSPIQAPVAGRLAVPGGQTSSRSISRIAISKL